MLWIFSFLAFWLVGSRAIWLHSLGVVLKNQRRMRCEMHVGNASQVPQLSGGELAPLTLELENLGFVQLGDIISRMDYSDKAPDAAPKAPIADPFASSSSRPLPPPLAAETVTDGIGRILAHPGHGCYASLISVISVSRFPAAMQRADLVNVAPFRTVIISVSTSDEEGWSFANHNRELQVFSLLIRHGRGLSHRQLGAGAAQLLQSHLDERGEIAARGGFEWDTAPSMEKYQAFEARGLRRIRAIYERTTILGAAWLFLTYRFSRHERWMGELSARGQ